MYFPFFPIPLRENQFSCNLTRQGSKKIIVGSFFHLLDWKVLFLLRLTAITRSFSSAKCWPPLTISAPAPLASASIRAGAGATKKQDSGGGGGGGTHYNNVCWYTGHWLGWDNNGDGAGLDTVSIFRCLLLFTLVEIWFMGSKGYKLTGTSKGRSHSK